MRNDSIGIWMDHAEAKLLEPGKTHPFICTVRSVAEGLVREDGQGPDGMRLGNFRSTDNEHHKHNMEREELEKFFRDLATQAMPYQNIFIFGPTTAHNEFANYLLGRNDFKGRTITVEKSDYLSDKEVAARVNDFFLQDEWEKKHP